MQFAAAVASFGMILRNSKYKGGLSYGAVLETASASRGEDRQGLRGEFLELVRAAQRLSGEPVSVVPIYQPPVVIGAPRVIVQPVAASRPRQPSVFGSLRLWWRDLQSEDALLIGIVAGVAASLLALAAGVWLIRWQTRHQLEPLPAKAIAREVGW
jgi:hypothetical protein